MKKNLTPFATFAAILLAAGVAFAASPHTAAAQERQDRDDFYYPSHLSLELHAGYVWWGEGLAAGARVGIPLVSGWLSRTHAIANTLSLTVGADFYFIREEVEQVYGPGFGIPITLEWRIHFVPMISLFAEAGVNVFVPTAVIADHRFEYPGAWFVGAIGIELHITRSFSLVGRLGTPYSTIGVAFTF